MAVDNSIHDPLLDIVAEMRTRSREVKEAFGGRPDGVENMLDIWANRIEALAERERAPVAIRAKSHGEAISRAMPCIDMQKARCALDSIMEDVGDYSLEGLEVVWCGIKGESLRMAKDAISRPPRQCDVGTAEEQEARMMRYCEGRKCEECQFFYGVNEGVNCDFTWAQTPYAEEGGRKREQK